MNRNFNFLDFFEQIYFGHEPKIQLFDPYWTNLVQTLTGNSYFESLKNFACFLKPDTNNKHPLLINFPPQTTNIIILR